MPLAAYSLRQHWLLLLSLAAAFLVNLSGFPLFDLDEGAFSEATREMLASGNFAATYLDGNPRYDKPIFSYWLQAASVSLFGLNEFAVRLPSAIAALLWVFAVFRFATEQWGRQTALLAALILANILWVALIGRAAIADAWLNLFLTLAMLDIYRYIQSPAGGVLLRVYVWFALGMLTKGPIAVGIPFLTSLIFLLWQGQSRLWLQAVINPAGWGVFLALLMPWLWLVYQDQGAGFFQGFLLDHNLRRFTETREGHGGDLYYYLLVLPIILLPFSGLLWPLTTQLRRLLHRPLNRYLLLWFAVVFVLVSVSQTQLPHYIVYGVTPLALIFARYRRMLATSPLLLIAPGMLLLLFLALPWIVELAAKLSDRAYERDLLSRGWQVFGPGYFITVVGAMIAMTVLFFQARVPVLDRLIGAGVLQSLVVFTVVINAVAGLQQAPVKEAASLAGIEHEGPVVAYKINMPSFSFYRQEITLRRPPVPGDLVFTRSDRLPELQQLFADRLLDVKFQKGGVLLIAIGADDESKKTAAGLTAL